MNPQLLMLDAAFKSLVVLAAALVTALLLRRTAATVHAVWTVGFCACLAVPLVTLIVPAWTLPVLPEPLPSPAMVGAERGGWNWSQNYLGDDSDMARQLAISSVPTYFLIGPDGLLVAAATEWSDMKSTIDSLPGPGGK